jgi:hypothetical protein
VGGAAQVYFPFISEVETKLRDGTVLKTRYGYDGREYNDATYCVISCFGLLTTVDDLGAFSALGSGGWDLSVLDNVRTKTGYHANTTQYSQVG